LARPFVLCVTGFLFAVGKWEGNLTCACFAP
jgi:hypothetical protein